MAGREAAAHLTGLVSEGTSADGGGGVVYPTVPRLELGSGGAGVGAPRSGVLSLARSGSPAPQPALD